MWFQTTKILVIFIHGTTVTWFLNAKSYREQQLFQIIRRLQVSSILWIIRLGPRLKARQVFLYCTHLMSYSVKTHTMPPVLYQTGQVVSVCWWNWVVGDPFDLNQVCFSRETDPTGPELVISILSICCAWLYCSFPFRSEPSVTVTQCFPFSIL